MRQLIRQRDGVAALVADEWRAVAAGTNGAGAVVGTDAGFDRSESGGGIAIRSLILPLARWQAERDQWWLWVGRLGVRIAPNDRVEALESDLVRLALIAIEFPGPSEGRGYSQARVLRDRFGFTGEVRAVGHVKLDQLFFLARCGFDALELADGTDPQQALQALRQFDVAYQPGAVASPALRRRTLADRRSS